MLLSSKFSPPADFIRNAIKKREEKLRWATNTIAATYYNTIWKEWYDDKKEQVLLFSWKEMEWKEERENHDDDEED